MEKKKRTSNVANKASKIRFTLLRQRNEIMKLMKEISKDQYDFLIFTTKDNVYTQLFLAAKNTYDATNALAEIYLKWI